MSDNTHKSVEQVIREMRTKTIAARNSFVVAKPTVVDITESDDNDDVIIEPLDEYEEPEVEEPVVEAEINELSIDTMHSYRTAAKAVLDAKQRGRPSKDRQLAVKNRTAGTELAIKKISAKNDAIAQKRAADHKRNVLGAHAAIPDTLVKHGFKHVGSSEHSKLFVKEHPGHALITTCKVPHNVVDNIYGAVAKFGSSTGWQGSSDHHYFESDFRSNDAVHPRVHLKRFEDAIQKHEDYHKDKALSESVEVNEVSPERLRDYIETASRWAGEDNFEIGNNIGRKNAENRAKLKPGETMPIHTPDDFDDRHRAALNSRRKRTGPNGITLAVSKLMKKIKPVPVKVNEDMSNEHPAVTQAKRALADSAPNGQHGYNVKYSHTELAAVKAKKCKIHHLQISKSDNQSYDNIKKNHNDISDSFRKAGIESVSSGFGFKPGVRPGAGRGIQTHHHMVIEYE